MLAFGAEHHDRRIGGAPADPVPAADDGTFRQPPEQRELVAQRAAVDDRRGIGKVSDQAEAADAAPRAAIEPGCEIEQQWRRFDAGGNALRMLSISMR